MTTRRLVAALLLAVAAAGAVPSPASADERYALVVFGATGGEAYARTWAGWRQTLEASLRDRLSFPPDHIVVLSADDADPRRRSTAAGVRAAIERIRTDATADDLVLVVLIGHGSADVEGAKFNLVGPDLDVSDWSALIDRLPGQVVFVNAAGASFPFLESLSRRTRIIVTATDSTAQRFDTLFPAEFVKALADPATDADKNGRVSLWEVFARASAAVRQYYEQRGQLATERALLDDTGDRVGLEAGAPGPDGALARTTYLDADPLAALADPEVAALVSRQRALEAQAEALKLRKNAMPLPQWEAEFEKLMIELAKVSRAIRFRS